MPLISGSLPERCFSLRTLGTPRVHTLQLSSDTCHRVKIASHAPNYTRVPQNWRLPIDSWLYLSTGAHSPSPSPLCSVYAVCAEGKPALSGLSAPVLPQLLGATLLSTCQRWCGCGWVCHRICKRLAWRVCISDSDLSGIQVNWVCFLLNPIEDFTVKPFVSNTSLWTVTEFFPALRKVRLLFGHIRKCWCECKAPSWEYVPLSCLPYLAWLPKWKP